MPKTRKQKEVTVDSLSKAISGAGSLVLAKFDKLMVSDERALRSALREKGVTYKVAKKSLLKKALVDSKIPGEMPELSGQVAIAYGMDPLDSAKGVSEFGSKHAGMLSILGGIYEGSFVSKEMMEMLAAIPGRQTLLAMLANVLNAPIQGLAIGLDAVAKKRG